VRPRFQGLIAVLLLAGCASATQWEKPGASREAMEADARSCAMAAEAYPTVPRVRTTRTGDDVLTAGSDRDTDRQLQEAQRVENCMRQKGYTLRAG
jgi:hypothetical protein